MDKEVEPSLSALAAIEAEWPVIEAERAVVDAECVLAARPSEVAVRRHRQAVAALAAVSRKSPAARVAVVKVRHSGGPRSIRPRSLAVAPASAAA
ncbi:DUF6284 family protein [Myceligenerans salitolerans]|uniref:DUF222 domain-containing protein n=1 Tax=Myceligenerans salitolerans TaxID=1230528 RepID=A0ABS3IDU6_9MICO|nr:DUF6284 family protein [Myceligenerans salitolerans]MBO0611105.1 hypothetical protein [Myceligenerans salitolerans]